MVPSLAQSIPPLNNAPKLKIPPSEAISQSPWWRSRRPSPLPAALRGVAAIEPMELASEAPLGHGDSRH